MGEPREVSMNIPPRVMMRYFPNRPLNAPLDRVELAFLASLRLVEANLDELLKDRRDNAAFFVIHDLARRMKVFRVRYPFVEVLLENEWKRIYPMFFDDKIEPEVFENLSGSLVAIVDQNGDVVYYEVEVAKL